MEITLNQGLRPNKHTKLSDPIGFENLFVSKVFTLGSEFKVGKRLAIPT